MYRTEHSSPNNSSRWLYSSILWILVFCFTLFVLWACYFQIDQTTRGPGTVIASSRVQIIQAVDGGVLQQLNVKEGDRVGKSEVLAVFDQSRFTASVKELEARLAALYAKEARLRAEITGKEQIHFPEILSSYSELLELEQALFKQRRQGIAQELKVLAKAVGLASQEAQLIEELEKSGDVNRSEVLKAQRLLNEAIGAKTNRENKYYQDIQQELTRVEDEIGQNEQIRAQRAQQLRDSVIKAPVAGIVKNVRVTTLGGVLRSGEELLQIVPVDDTLIVEAKIRPADIADLQPGLSASIKFDAFDYTIFGAVEGNVDYISADTIREETSYGLETYYRVHLVTNDNPVTSRTGRSLQILPGMTASVDIRTGKRSVIDVLLKPVKKTFSEAFHEK